MSAPRWAIVTLAGAAVLLAACSSSPSTPARTTTTQRAHASTTSSSTTSSTTSSSTTSTTAASTACNHVTAVAGQSQGAAGTITGVITVTNAGTSACETKGYPTVQLFSGSGAPLTVTMVDGLSVTLSPPANAAPASVSLPASGSAQFAYQISDVPVGSETSCPSSETSRIVLPGATSPSPSFALSIAPCGNGTVRVSPVYTTS